MKAWLGILAAVLLFAPRRAMARIKDGVQFGNEIKPTTRRIIDAAELAFGYYNLPATITSAQDGQHMPRSKHYSGDALDWRIWESDQANRTRDVAAIMAYQLGSDYDVIVESTHIHVEYDPKVYMPGLER